MVDLSWILAAVAVAAGFVVVGFAFVVGLRLYEIARATFFVGPVPRADVVALILIAIGVPLGTWSLAFQGVDPSFLALLALAAVGGSFAGWGLARLELRQRRAILAAIAEVQLGAVGWPALGVADRSLAFVNGTPKYVRSVLDAIILVFNSPWVSRALDMGFSTFRAKAPHERRRYLDRWAGDPSLRYGLEFVKVVLAFGAYDDPRVSSEIRYAGPLVPDGSPGGPDVFCPYDPEDAATRGVRGDDRFRRWWSA